MENRNDYVILFNAVVEVIGELEKLPIDNMPEIAKCIQTLKDAQRLAEKVHMSAVCGK